VARNRARRLLREGWRRLAPRVRGYEVVLVAQPAIEGAKAQDVIADLEMLFARAGLL
jgi:ribonuclease P protein component